ncbi:hypothetical protein Hanom_Chr13g01206861 [Helianthus anomalus]
MSRFMVMMVMIWLLRTAGTDVEEGVVVDCEDDKFQLTTFESDIHDSKCDKFFSSLLEMEDLKKKFKDDLDNKTEPKGKANVVGDENESSKVSVQLVMSKFEMDLDNFLIPKNKFHVYMLT